MLELFVIGITIGLGVFLAPVILYVVGLSLGFLLVLIVLAIQLILIPVNAFRSLLKRVVAYK